MKILLTALVIFLSVGNPGAFAANGELLGFDHNTLIYKMLDAQSTSASSPWVDFRGFILKSIDCDAIETGATVEIMVKNDVNRPLQSTDASIAITLQPGTLTGTDWMPHRWYKLKKTQGGTPVPTTCIVEAK